MQYGFIRAKVMLYLYLQNISFNMSRSVAISMDDKCPKGLEAYMRVLSTVRIWSTAISPFFPDTEQGTRKG
jgi:hypothetical protein